MKRIAVFAEGQTEQIFVREFLLRVLDAARLSFECLELKAHTLAHVPWDYPNPYAEIHFMIIDVHGGEGVLSSIKEREKDLIVKGGFDRIIGIKDMYSEAYVKRSPVRIDDNVTKDFISNHNATVRSMTYSGQIGLYFAIMEVEAWFLGMYNLFCRINPKLTVEFIREKLNIDLTTTDPQKAFYRPSEQVNQICGLCGRSYGKKRDEVESICSKVNSEDFENAKENSRCQSFANLYQEITSYS